MLIILALQNRGCIRQLAAIDFVDHCLHGGAIGIELQCAYPVDELAGAYLLPARFFVFSHLLVEFEETPDGSFFDTCCCIGAVDVDDLGQALFIRKIDIVKQATA